MSTPVQTSAEEPLVYRPLSGLAIAGLCISALYGAIILYAGFRSLSQGEPLLMEGYWLLMPLAGGLSSLLGQVQIRNSEGTRAGLKLTRWGLGLSVCFGLGYYVYSLGTGLAIRQQANRFVLEQGNESGFVWHLRRAAASPKDYNAAFLLALPPAARGTLRPENEPEMREAFDRPGPDGQPGQLSEFRTKPIVFLFQSGSGEETTVEPLGVVEWSYGKDGFRVRRLYRVTREDMIAKVLLSTKSAEGREGQSRRWHVVMDESYVEQSEPTDRGKVLERLRIQAVEHIGQWQTGMNKGAPWNGFAALDATNWESLAPSASLRSALQDRLKVMFTGTEQGRVLLGIDLKFSTWRRDKGKLKIGIPVTLVVADPDNGGTFELKGEMEVSTKEDVGAIESNLAPSWEITRISFQRVQSKGPKGEAKGEDGT